jgi:hypothetical protein
MIWKDHTKFPPNLHTFFLALFEKFEISYPLSSKHSDGAIDREGKSLIPSLLSAETPADLTHQWESYLSLGGHVLNRYCQFDFIPSGKLY